MLLLTVSIWALNFTVSKYILDSGFRPLSYSAVLSLLGSRQLESQSYDLGWLAWVGFVFAVLGPLVLTNLLWFTAIDRVGPSRAALFANLQPFLAAIVALLILSEKLTRLQVAGGLAIAAGIVLSRGRQPPLEPAE